MPRRIDPAIRAQVLQYALAFPHDNYKTIAETCTTDSCKVTQAMVSQIMIRAGFRRRAPRKGRRSGCGCAVPSLPCVYARIHDALRRLAAALRRPVVLSFQTKTGESVD